MLIPDPGRDERSKASRAGQLVAQRPGVPLWEPGTTAALGPIGALNGDKSRPRRAEATVKVDTHPDPMLIAPDPGEAAGVGRSGMLEGNASPDTRPAPGATAADHLSSRPRQATPAMPDVLAKCWPPSPPRVATRDSHPRMHAARAGAPLRCGQRLRPQLARRPRKATPGNQGAGVADLRRGSDRAAPPRSGGPPFRPLRAARKPGRACRGAGAGCAPRCCPA